MVALETIAENGKKKASSNTNKKVWNKIRKQQQLCCWPIERLSKRVEQFCVTNFLSNRRGKQECTPTSIPCVISLESTASVPKKKNIKAINLLITHPLWRDCIQHVPILSDFYFHAFTHLKRISFKVNERRNYKENPWINSVRFTLRGIKNKIC